MKNIIIAIVALLVIAFFAPKPYISSPGFVTEEANQEFNAHPPRCYGFSRLTNAEAMAADAPGKSLCFGLLVK